MSLLAYKIALPPPWVRISLRAALHEQVRSLIGGVTHTAPSTIPPDEVAKHRRALEHRLLAQAQKAAANGGVDLYLPAGDWHGFLVSASFVVSEVVPPSSPGDVGPGDVLARLLGEDDTRTETIDDAAWVRTDTVRVSGDLAEGVKARHVTYATALPDGQRSWALVAFSAAGAEVESGAAGEVLVDWFDAVMTTWRWVRATQEEKLVMGR